MFIVFLYILFALIAVLLTFVVLIQDDQGDGIGGLFGGGSSTAFGTRSGNVLTRFTGILAGLFFITCFVLGLLNRSPNLAKIEEEAAAPQTSFLAPLEKERLEASEASVKESSETAGEAGSFEDRLGKPFSGVLPPLP
ncbi:MAG: preprotein translocase subunit SecG [Spirochaetales bacterium]|nr:preprotein translocase subunit SecG [Spirochaetales bacterium]